MLDFNEKYDEIFNKIREMFQIIYVEKLITYTTVANVIVSIEFSKSSHISGFLTIF